MTRLDDPDLIRREYETEAGLRARVAVYRGVYGVQAPDVALAAVAETRPRTNSPEPHTDRVPHFDGPLEATRVNAFVAGKAA